MVAQTLVNTNGPVKKVSGADHPLYSFGGQVFIAPQKGGPIVISKSQERIDSVRDLLEGKGESLATGKALEALAPMSNSFFLVGVADALDEEINRLGGGGGG